MLEQYNSDEAKATKAPPQPEGSVATVLLHGISDPGQNDVKFGRGGDTNYHIGNSRFRHFCGSYKKKYQMASKEGRQAVVQEILDDWRSQNPPGRFLARTNPAAKEISVWHDVGDELAFKKTIKVLGEGLGVKRRKRKAQKSPAQPDPGQQISVKPPGDMVGVGFAGAVSSVKNVAPGQMALPASPDSSKSSNSKSSLWDISLPLVYTEPHDNVILLRNQACQGHHVYGMMAEGLGTQNSKQFDTEWRSDCPGDAMTKAAIVNSSFAGERAVHTQTSPVNSEMQWKAALRTQLPVAASLTSVFGNNEHGSSSDSGD